MRSPLDPARTAWRRVLRSRFAKRRRKEARQRRMEKVRQRRDDPRYTGKDARLDFFLYRAGLFTPLVGVESDLGLFCVSPYDYGQGRRLFVNRRIGYRPLARAFEATRAWGDDPAAGGRVFLDVGANIGIVTITALKRYDFRVAVSVEPEPWNFRLLEANLALNRGDAEVRTFNVAVSTDEGEARLRVNPGSHGEHALVAGPGDGGEDVVTVPTRPLDALLAEAGHRPEQVGFLKVDTEGHEPRVLESAPELLSVAPPTMIEYAPFRYAEPDYGLDRLERLAGDHYSHFADLRRSGEPELWPVSELPSLREVYSAESKGITDVLLIRR